MKPTSLETHYQVQPEGLQLGRSDIPPKLGTFTPMPPYLVTRKPQQGTTLSELSSAKQLTDNLVPAQS